MKTRDYRLKDKSRRKLQEENAQRTQRRDQVQTLLLMTVAYSTLFYNCVISNTKYFEMSMCYAILSDMSLVYECGGLSFELFLMYV